MPALSPRSRVLASVGLAVTSLVAPLALSAPAGAQTAAPGVTAPPASAGDSSTARSRHPGQDYRRAAAWARRHDRLPTESANFTRSGRLEALDSIPRGAATGRLRRVAFFLDGRYIGNDGPRESILSSVRAVDRSTVAVTYTLWRNTDVMAHPTGGHATVRYRLTRHGVRALDRVPPYEGRIHR
ncbi:MAG: hypothetical protein JWN46_1574 [Acidimicrobiales bacterium]|nr:hypothetical protein [Acidimicrobiales bacterium]